MPSKIVEAVSAGTSTYALYEIDTDKGLKYMRVDRAPARNDERMVVVVDATRFLRLWNSRLASSGPSHWRKVQGFAAIHKRFDSGKARPVQLARAEIRKNGFFGVFARLLSLFSRKKSFHSHELKIVEGERRTLWLLANGAATFPLECGARCANDLHRLIGVDSIPPVSVESLTASH